MSWYDFGAEWFVYGSIERRHVNTGRACFGIAFKSSYDELQSTRPRPFRTVRSAGFWLGRQDDGSALT